MRLYLVLLPMLLLSQNNLWSWQTTRTTMTKKEIAGQLQEKRAALAALLEKNNLTLEAVLSAQQLTIVQQVDAVLGIAEAPQDIGKKAFVEYVQDWVTGIKSTLSTCDRTDIEVSVLDAKTSFVGYIHNVKFPISAKLWNSYLKPALDNLGELATPKAIAEAMTGALEEFEQYMQNKFEQTEHFKKNKATYAKIKKKQLEGVLMTADEFRTWLNKAIAEGKELEEKQEALDKEQKEKQEALDREFNIAYKDWYDEQRKILREGISKDSGTDSINDMSKEIFVAVLIREVKEWKAQPELAQYLSQGIVDNLKGDSLKIADYINAMDAAITGIPISKDIIKENWLKDPQMPNFVGLITALVTGNTKEFEIIAAYVNWFEEVSSVVNALGLPASRQFIKEKLLAGLEKELKAPAFNFFLQELTKNYQAVEKQFLSLEETSQIWRTSLQTVILDGSTITKKSPYSGRQDMSVDTITGLLIGEVPSDTLQQVFKQALRPLPKPDALSKGEFVNLVVYLNDGTVLTSKLMTTINKAEKVPYAYPSSVQLDVAKGKSAYDFEAKPIFDQSPVVRNQEMVTVDFEYTLAFSRSRGSSSGGGETSVEYTNTNSVDISREKSTTKGKEKTKSTGYNETISGSTTTGVTGEVEGGIGILSGKVSTSREVTIGGSAEWTSEESTTEINTTTTTTGVTTGVSNSVASMNKETWGNTVEHGNDESYLTVKGVLTCSDIDQETMVLSIEEVTFTSPNMKGLAINRISPQTGKTVRWKQ